MATTEQLWPLIIDNYTKTRFLMAPENVLNYLGQAREVHVYLGHMGIAVAPPQALDSFLSSTFKTTLRDAPGHSPGPEFCIDLPDYLANIIPHPCSFTIHRLIGRPGVMFRPYERRDPQEIISTWAAKVKWHTPT